MIALILVAASWAQPIRSEVPGNPKMHTETCPAGYDLYHRNLAINGPWEKIKQPATTNENARNFTCQPLVKHSSLQDDGFGKCPAFSHYHMPVDEAKRRFNGQLATDQKDEKFLLNGEDVESLNLDGLCHDDNTDAPITERPKLPKSEPQFKPGKEPLV